jgi:hypothetical protein
LRPKHFVRVFAVALLLSVSITGATPSSVEAQTTISAVPKGALGIGLLGAELGLMVPAWAGMDQTWGYVVFPIVGAAGGAIGGYYLLDSPNRSSYAIAALAAGMAMIIPSVVIALSATAYDPDDDTSTVEVERIPTADEVEGVAPASDDDFEEAGRTELSTYERLAAGPGLVRRVGGEWQLRVPGLAVQPVAAEGRTYAELNVSLLSGTF